MTQLTPVSTDRLSYTNADVSGLVDATSYLSAESHIASVLDCLWATDADHCISYISPSLAQVMQERCAIKIGMKLSDWFSGCHYQGSSPALADVLDTQAAFRELLAAQPIERDDNQCSLLLSATPRFDADGVFLGFVGSIIWMPQTLVANNHHRETRLEQELEKSFLAEHVMNAISDPIFAKDEQLRFVMCNSAFARLYNARPCELIGKRVDELTNHVENAHYSQSEQRVLDTGEVFEEEQTFHQNSILSAHIVRKSRIETESGRYYMVGALIDVTKLKHRSEELDRARTRAQSLNDDLQKTLDSLTMGVLLLDDNGCLKTANSTYFDLWQMDRERINMGDSFEQLMEISRANGNKVVPDDEWSAYKKRRLKEIRIGSLDPTEFKLSDGRIFLFSITKLTGEQRLLSYLDVTDAKARENALREAEQMAVLAARSKMDFLSSIGHDIRTPMNGITGMAELLTNSKLDVRQRTFVDIIARSSQSLMAIVNDIIDFTHIDASTLELDITSFSLRDIVADLETVLAHKARDKSLELNVHIGPAVPNDLMGDKKRFRQILGNLLSNAIKFTETGSVSLLIEGHEDAGTVHLRVEVQDTGIGIAHDRLPSLFAKNDITVYNMDSAKSALGLAIVGSLVELMEGDVMVESTLGEGSRFEVTLDLPVDANTHFGQMALPVLEGARILVLDQDIEAHTCLTHHLKACGADVCVIAEASIGAIFIEAAKTIDMEINLIIADQGLLEQHFTQMVSDDALKLFDPSKLLLMTDIDSALGDGTLMLQSNAGCLVKPIQTSLAIERIISALDNNMVDGDDKVDIDHHYILPPQPIEPAVVHAGIDMTEAEAEAQSSETQESDGVLDAAEAMPMASEILEDITDQNTQADMDEGALRSLRKGKPMDILIVEDNEINQLVYSQILSETGMAFKIVATGADLLEAFDEMRPRMILMDLSLPDMDGFEVTQKLRRAHGSWGANVPIVGVLTPANDESAAQCLEQGMDDALSKPISPNALLQKILFWLERSLAQNVA